MDKRILKIAIPNIISNITVPLLGMIDIAIVGHLDSPLYIGAITVATMIFNFLYWNFSFLRMGTSGFTAQAFGAENKQECANTLTRSLFIALLVSAVILILQNQILNVAFHFVEATPDMQLYAESYFYIYIWAAPAILGMYAFTGWFIGMQDAKTPMYIAICVNIINIALSFFFVYVLKMKIEGVALASTLAQLSGFAIAIIIWLKKHKNIRAKIQLNILKDINGYIPFFKVNRDIYIRTLCLITVTTFFTATSSKMGNTLLSVNALMMQLFMLFSFIMDGFAYAAEALTGRYIGAKDSTNIKLLIKRLFVWGAALSVLFTLLYALFSESIFGLLTDEQSIIDASKNYLAWVLLIPIISFSAFLWDGVFIGATASKQMRNSMLVAILSFFIVFFCTKDHLGNNALWLSFIVYLGMRGIMQTLIFRKMQTHLVEKQGY